MDGTELFGVMQQSKEGDKRGDEVRERWRHGDA